MNDLPDVKVFWGIAFAFFLVSSTLGAWLGHSLSKWRIRRLEARVSLLKLEAATRSARAAYLP